MNKKALIVGCGKIAGLYEDIVSPFIYSHSKAFYKNSLNYKLSFCDIYLDKAKKLAQKYGSKKYENNLISAINKYTPDVVSICTPDKTHFNIIRRILTNNIVPEIIFVEKPVCQTKSELKDIIKIADENNIQIIVNHSRRFSSLYNYLKNKYIKNNTWGKLIRADVFYYSGWQHNGIHIIDTLMYLFDEDINFVKLIKRGTSPYKNDPTLEFQLKFNKSNAQIFLHSFDEKYYQIFDFDLKFEQARLKIENFEEKVMLQKKVVNEMHENVLVYDDIKLNYKYHSPMENAVNVISNYFKKEEPIPKEYLIQGIVRTMDIIWEGEHGKN